MIEICTLCLAPRPCRCQRSNIGANPKAYKRWRSAKYLDFVRAMPCCIPDCGEWSRCEPHHAGPRGMGQKVDDFLCIPLCRDHHDEAHSHGRTWSQYSNIQEYQLQTIAAAIMAGVLH